MWHREVDLVGQQRTSPPAEEMAAERAWLLQIHYANVRKVPGTPSLSDAIALVLYGQRLRGEWYSLRMLVWCLCSTYSLLRKSF